MHSLVDKLKSLVGRFTSIYNDTLSMSSLHDCTYCLTKLPIIIFLKSFFDEKCQHWPSNDFSCTFYIPVCSWGHSDVFIRLDNAILRKHFGLHLPISSCHWSLPNWTAATRTNASDFSCRFNPRDSQRLYLNDNAALMNSHISAIDPTVVFIHGFTQTSDSLSASTVRDGKLLYHIGDLVAMKEVASKMSQWCRA